MNWFQHFVLRWRISKCKTNYEYLHLWTDYMMKDDPLNTMSEEECRELLKELANGENKLWKKYISTLYTNIATRNGKHLT